MSAETVEIVRRAHDILDSGDFEQFLDFIHPEFVTETPPELALEPQTYVGPQGIRRWFESFYDAVDQIRFEPEEYIDLDDDRVLVSTRLIVRGRDSGIEAEQRMAQVWTLRDGQAYRLVVFPDKESALEALELEAQRQT